MSINKKYFYLKLKDTFFDSEEMKLLESMKNGIEYQNLYLKLCLLSLKNEGQLIFREIIPYDLNMLSTILRINIDTVKTGIEILSKQFGLIEILDNGVMYMTDIHSLIGRGSSEAERKAEYRKKINDDKRDIVPWDIVPTLSKNTQRTKSQKVPLELDLDLELDLERERNKGQSPPPGKTQINFPEIERPKHIAPQKKLFLTYIYLLENEYNALCIIYPEDFVKDYLRQLNNFIGKNNGIYKKDHYFTLKSWMERDSIQTNEQIEENEKDENNLFDEDIYV